MDAIKHSDDYSNQSIDETLAELQTDISRGLTDGEAQQRIARFGYNEIEEKEEPLWHRIFRRF
jgi:H+-transporting ATPase